ARDQSPAGHVQLAHQLPVVPAVPAGEAFQDDRHVGGGRGVPVGPQPLGVGLAQALVRDRPGRGDEVAHGPGDDVASAHLLPPRSARPAAGAQSVSGPYPRYREYMPYTLRIPRSTSATVVPGRRSSTAPAVA